MLGSPRVITDQSAQIVSRRDFMPFGEDLSRPNYGTDNLRQKFTGYEKDNETGLDFAEARYYNNSVGRFTAVDPLLASGKSANPQTFNRYVYSLNSPLMMSDPSGMQAGWAYRDVNGGTQFTYLSDIASANNLADTQFGKDSGFVPWKQWTRGDFVLWNDRTASRLHSDGTMTNFTMEGFGTDEQWNQIVTEWYAGKNLADIGMNGWGQKVVEAAYNDSTREKNGIILTGEALGFSKSQVGNAVNNPIIFTMAPQFQLARNASLAAQAERKALVNSWAEIGVSGVKGNQKFSLGVDFSSGNT